ncbi:MAG: Lin0512 family protein [Paracoccaceae bacterium]|nr:Lin0512 family protein [Paracoccaceae bacterium]MDG2259675.1 Lin0512 family protein [Paracoccaceae bacterium]
MPVTHLLTEFGMGSSLRRQDYTEASVRAIKHALWRNSINLAELFGKEKTDMIIDVKVGVGKPDAVDVAALKDVFPYGHINIEVTQGGLDVERPEGAPNVMANVAISVSLDLGDAA